MRLLILSLTILAFVAGVTLDYLGIADREIGEPLYRLAIAVLIPCVVLLLNNEATFRAWFRFAAWWIPLSVLLIALTPVNGGSWMPLYLVNKETVTFLVGGLFIAISLIGIVRKSRKR